VGCGIRDKTRIGCSGKIHSAFEMARRIAQGADYCNTARAMMFALGCIQAQRCQTNRCPVGVATQDPRRVRGLVVDDKAERVCKFQQNTIKGFNEIIAALGLHCPEELQPALLMRRVSATTVQSYAQLYRYLQPGELLSDTPGEWQSDWNAASADKF